MEIGELRREREANGKRIAELEAENVRLRAAYEMARTTGCWCDDHGRPCNMTLQELQDQNRTWAYRNFGPEPEKWRNSFMGVVEEVGELSHALLKQDQGIRGTHAEHEEKAQDAVADIIIYLADLCNRRGWSLQACVETAWAEVVRREWEATK